MDPAQRRAQSQGLVFLVPALIVGVLVAAQWQTQAGRTPLASRYQLQLEEAVATLSKEQAQLKVELGRLRAELDATEAQNAAQGGASASLKAEIEDLRAYAGLTPVTGEGITVRLNDAHLPASAPARAIQLGIVHSTDLADVFNAAWKSGATAIAVNGERIAGTSACVGAVIQINGTLMSPPFVVQIPGAPARLLATFNDPREMVDQKSRRDAFGLGFSVAPTTTLVLPDYSGSFTIRFAAPK